MIPIKMQKLNKNFYSGICNVISSIIDILFQGDKLSEEEVMMLINAADKVNLYSRVAPLPPPNLNEREIITFVKNKTISLLTF